MLSRLFLIAFFASILLLVTSWVMDKRLPSPQELIPELQYEPVQIQLDKQTFRQQEHGYDYFINPLFSYELYGLVVSKHEASSSFTERAHERAGDYLNTTDLCVIWGKNAFGGIYQDIKFSSGQWTCFFEPKSGREVRWEDFDSTGISNNHMLISSPEIAKKLKDVRIGDQIYFKGYLAEYGVDNRLIRGTSIVRTDEGQGACETVYTKELEIIKAVPRIWEYMKPFASGGIVVFFLFWLVFPGPEKRLAKETNLSVPLSHAGLKLSEEDLAKISVKKQATSKTGPVRQSQNSTETQKFFIMRQEPQEEDAPQR